MLIVSRETIASNTLFERRCIVAAPEYDAPSRYVLARDAAPRWRITSHHQFDAGSSREDHAAIADTAGEIEHSPPLKLTYGEAVPRPVELECLCPVADSGSSAAGTIRSSVVCDDLSWRISTRSPFDSSQM